MFSFFIWQMYCRIHGGSNINAYNHRVGVLAHTYEYHFDQHWGEFGCEKSVFFVSFFVSFCLAQHWQDGKNCWLLIRQTIMHHRDQSTPQCCSTMFVLILIWKAVVWRDCVLLGGHWLHDCVWRQRQQYGLGSRRYYCMFCIFYSFELI